MSKKQMTISIIVLCVLVAALLVGALLINVVTEKETIGEAMKDAVLHETGKISLFGIMEVNPSVISDFVLTGIVIVTCLVIRFLIIPKFKPVPGKFQSVLEMAVGYFDNLAKTNSPHRNKFLGAYVFSAGSYIFLSTLFELFGFQAVTTEGHSIALPAPLSDVNGAIALGCLSYLIILSGGIAGNKLKGVGATLKDFSLPISMSFRLFGALLSGLLVTELVYYYVNLSFVLPVIVGVLFTLLHAIIQTYVLTMLTTVFYGEVSEPSEKKPKKAKKKKIKSDNKVKAVA